MPRAVPNDVVEKIDAATVRRLVTLVELEWPDWTGFDDPRYLRDERDYKVTAVHKARDRLAETELRNLVERSEFESVVERAIEVGRYTNLLYVSMPEKGDLGLLFHPDLDKEEFSVRFLDLLYGNGSSIARLGRFVDWVDSRGLPNRWTLPTYFLFMVHSDQEMFVKPETTTGFFEALGRNIAFRGRPQPGLYELLLQVSQHLFRQLEAYRPKDMVDIQSFIWMVAQFRSETGSDGPDTNYWKISPGADGIYWGLCKEGGFTSIGWDELGDVRALSQDDFEDHFHAVAREIEDPDVGWGSGGREQIWKFLHAIKPGDYVVANRGTHTVLGIGRVVGECEFHEKGPQTLRIPVKWFDTKERTVRQPGWRRTLIQLDRDAFQQILEAPGPQDLRPQKDEVSLERIAQETGHPNELLSRWVRAIERKKQAILFGPPGTGKTFVAKKLAQHLVGGGSGSWQLLQFHPSYAYEDFMQGIRPYLTDDGRLAYRMMDGRFLEFCQKAEESEGISVLILDEINRSNLSRVFGELMYLLEYREASIPLAGGDRFRIPENVRLIGTMNTADRSIALVDHALRRRFAFLRLDPNFDALVHYHSRRETGFNPSGLIEVLDHVNSAIDDASYSVGISYFCRDDVQAQVEDIWRMEIEPYLEEFFFNESEKVASLRWESVESQILQP